MRFLPLAFVVGGALAAVQADQGEEQTITVTEYTTYCPSATMSQAPQFTTSAGQTFSISRPLITTTVTHCEKCSSSTPAPSVIPVEVPSSNPSPTPSSSSIVLGPSSVDAVSASSRAWASASASGSGSPSGPSSPLFTGAASRAAASAGVGLSAVLGAVAFLL